jgi:hypothetical protein
MCSGYRDREMALSKRFNDVVLNGAVRIGDLAMYKPYPVLRAKSVDTKYGISILLTIRESEDLCGKEFLPRRYSLGDSEENVKQVNEQTVQYRLIYKGLSSTSTSYILEIESAS